MGKLRIFNFMTLNGFFEGSDKDTSWHVHGEEEDNFAIEMLSQGDILLFGRVTYEMMVGYWTSEFALKNDLKVAEGMNNADKIVFSKTLERVEWKNARLIKEDVVEEMSKIKQTGRNMSILGSGKLGTFFASKGLIDEYQIMVDPILLGQGIPLFNGLNHILNLKLKKTRTFKSGTVLLTYENQS
jgi:dihydrofolate reductase